MAVEIHSVAEVEELVLCFSRYSFRAPLKARKSKATTMTQGQLESSNVKPVLEMTRMIDTLRREGLK